MNWKQGLLAFSVFLLGVLAVILINSIKTDNFLTLIMLGIILVSLGAFAAFGFVALWSRLED